MAEGNIVIDIGVDGAGAIAWDFKGDAYVGTDISTILMNVSGTITKVLGSVDNAPVGADFKIDITIDGTSIWTDTDRLIIANGATSGNITDIDLPDFSAGETIGINWDQVGSTTPGGDHVRITVEFE